MESLMMENEEKSWIWGIFHPSQHSLKLPHLKILTSYPIFTWFTTPYHPKILTLEFSYNFKYGIVLTILMAKKFQNIFFTSKYAFTQFWKISIWLWILCQHMMLVTWFMIWNDNQVIGFEKIHWLCMSLPPQKWATTQIFFCAL